MHDFEDQDTCRICSAPAEPEQPLFHPCKCSGTIRYIHQDCLTTWLAHSKKKSCDVCKHPYSFTKVYAPDMPPSLPPLLFVRRLLQHLFLTLLFILRGISVAAIWLGVLPWVTVWTWRMYFSMGESTAWWISDRPRAPPEAPLFNKIRYDTQAPPPKNFLARINSNPFWMAISADIFTGQIIASLIVLTFVAVFLLREWISQNARPGVFEDEEPLPEDPFVQPQQQQQPGPIPPPGPPAARLVFVDPHERRPLPPVPPVNPPAPRPLEGRELHPRMDALLAMEVAEPQRQNPIPPVASDPSRWDLEGHCDEIDRRARKRKKKVGKSDGEDDDGVRVRHKMEKDAEIRRKLFHRRIHLAKTTSVRHRMTTRRAASSSPSPSPLQEINNLNYAAKQEQEFPLTASVVESNRDRSSEGPSRESSVDLTGSWQSLPASSTSLPASPSVGPSQHSPKEDQPSPGSPFPSVTLQPPSGSIPFSLRPTQPHEPPPPYPSRPVLPTIPIPRAGPSSPFLYSPGRTDVDSPSHSTYRAPEELAASLEAGPSDYFPIDPNGQREVGDLANKKMKAARESAASTSQTHSSGDDMESLSDLDQEEIQAEHDHYFGDTSGLVSLSDSESDITTEDDGRGLGDLDDDDGQPAGLFVGEDAGAGAVRDGEDAFRGVNVVREDGPLHGQPAVAANQLPAEEPAANAENEDADANVEDDMEGAMEAIGMRGPIFGVFQNAALMIFVLDTAIGLCIWFPFTVGKSTALLSLDPHRMLQVMHLPIRAMRLVTDPVVDLVAYILLDLTFPWALGALSVFFRIFMFFGSNSIGKLLPISTSSSASELSSNLLNHTSGFITKPLNFIMPWSASSNFTASTASSASLSWLDTLLDYLGPFEPYFVRIGSEVREAVASAQATWIRLAVGSGPTNRAFAILLGYVVISFVFCVYLNLVNVGNVKTAGTALRNVIKQQLLVIKVAAFIFIELVVFPLGCGIVLDLCTVWLFPEANMLSRIAFFWQAPLTAMFYHWVAGTMFMYTFAVLLSGCRNVMRPGAMWFIKDPQDQNSHPIRDILDRPTLVQLRKIFISGVMYSFVVACVVGSLAGLLLMGSKSIMPFRWKNREPLSHVPVDLLFLHLVLPYTMHYFRPKRAVKEVATLVWKFLATRLRLTSFFFGGRHPPEEFTPNDWRENLIRSETYVAQPEDVPDGSFRRVPATDNLALPRDMRATVPVTPDGEPLDDAGKALMAMQNAEAEKAKHVVQDDYTIVYIPPKFRWRIIIFITLLWIISAICIGFAVAVPLSLGRGFFRLFTPRDVHDGYSFIVGFYLIWVCYLIGRAVDRLDRRRKRRSDADGPRAELGLLVAKRGLLWLAKVAYMTFSLGIVVPILLAVVIDFYIVLPIRFSLDPTMVPRVRIVDQWSLGLVYAKIGIYVQRVQPPNRISAGLQHIMQLGWTRLDPVMATKELIAPLVGGLLGMIILPGAAFKALLLYFPEIAQDNRFTFMHVYPLVFIVASAVRSAINLYGALSAWSIAIRDKEFLVEMRLRNHDSASMEDVDKAVAGADTTPQNADVVAESDRPGVVAEPMEEEN